MICTVAKMRTTFAIAILLIPLSLPATPCPELPGNANWSEQEHWVWNEVCAGREANLQQRYGGNETPGQGENWPVQRDLSERLLKTILLDDIYRSRIPDQGVLIVGARFREKIDLSHSQLKHDLWLRWSRFEGTGTEALKLVGTEINGQLNLDHSMFLKHVNMDSMRAGSLFLTNGYFPSVWLASAKFELLRIDDTTVDGELQMTNLEVARDISLRNSTLTKVVLRSAKVGGTLAIEGPRRHEDPVAESRGCRSNTKPRATHNSQSVDLTAATVGTLSLGSLCYGPVDAPKNWGVGAELILTSTSVRTLQDGLCRDNGSNCTDDTWPEHLKLNGFTYQELENFDYDREIDMAARPAAWWIEWLERQGYSRRPYEYSLQPYEHLASILSKLGYKDKAEDILYAGKNRELESTTFPASIKLWLERVLIGYGYRIRYAVMWVAGFIILGAMVLRFSGEGRRNRMPYGIAFSFDMLLPIVKLREYHYRVDLKGWARYYFYFHKLMGYVLASFLIAGLAGLTK
jgi:hypothetical protein